MFIPGISKICFIYHDLFCELHSYKAEQRFVRETMKKDPEVMKFLVADDG